MKEYFAGIDIGSTMTKVVILDDEVMASVTGPTGPEQRRLANRVMKEALGAAGLAFEDICYIVSTGYGRLNVPFADKQVTEISCHAKGVAHLFPEAKTVIDIGGQDSKGIKIGKNGRPANFIMNDNDIFDRNFIKAGGLADRSAGLVHEGRRFEQEHFLTVDLSVRRFTLKFDPKRRAGKAAVDFIHRHKTYIVTVSRILRSGIAKSDQEMHGELS